MESHFIFVPYTHHGFNVFQDHDKKLYDGLLQ